MSEKIEREALRKSSKLTLLFDHHPYEIQTNPLDFHQKNLGFLPSSNLQVRIKFAVFQFRLLFEPLITREHKDQPNTRNLNTDLSYEEGASLESATTTPHKFRRETASKWRWKIRKKKVRDGRWMVARLRDEFRAGSWGFISGQLSLPSIFISSLGVLTQHWCAFRSHMYSFPSCLFSSGLSDMQFGIPLDNNAFNYVWTMLMLLNIDGDCNLWTPLTSSKAEEADEVTIDPAEKASTNNYKKDDTKYFFESRVVFCDLLAGRSLYIFQNLYPEYCNQTNLKQP